MPACGKRSLAARHKRLEAAHAGRGRRYAHTATSRLNLDASPPRRTRINGRRQNQTSAISKTKFPSDLGRLQPLRPHVRLDFSKNAPELRRRGRRKTSRRNEGLVLPQEGKTGSESIKPRTVAGPYGENWWPKAGLASQTRDVAGSQPAAAGSDRPLATNGN